jgi:hypothetical protein
MKGLFWKRLAMQTPALPPRSARSSHGVAAGGSDVDAHTPVKEADFVWLVDADMAVDDFDLPRALDEMSRARVPLVRRRNAPHTHV